MSETNETCPNDTNGDGDCGQRGCPHCGGGPKPYRNHPSRDAQLAALQQSLRERDEQLAAVRKERDVASQRADHCEAIIAIAVDHMNTQAREWQVDECKLVYSDCYGLRSLAESLWLRSMKREDRLRDGIEAATARAEAAEREAGRLRLGITAIANQCQSVDTLTPLPGVARQFAADVAMACAALLAQPEKEAGDGN